MSLRSQILRKFRESPKNDTIELAKQFRISEGEAYQHLNDALKAERQFKERSIKFELGVSYGRVN